MNCTTLSRLVDSDRRHEGWRSGQTYKGQFLRGQAWSLIEGVRECDAEGACSGYDSTAIPDGKRSCGGGGGSLPEFELGGASGRGSSST